MARVAVVTGGTRGIGEAISKALKAAGYKVAANYGGNDAAAEKFKAATGIAVYKWDVSSYESCAAGLKQVEADLGPVEVLVNNAGITRDTMFHRMTPEQWGAVINTNLNSLFNMCRPVIEGMRAELLAFVASDGRALFDLPDAPRPGEDAPGREVVFLPDFDNLLLAHKDRRRVIADEHRPLVATKNLRIKATYLLDGVVAGTWSIKATKTKATVTLEAFGKKPTQAVKKEAEALARFLEPTAKTFDVTSAPL